MNKNTNPHKRLLENICEGMTFKDRLLTEEVYNEFHRVGRMISEAQLTQDQIQQLFKSVADGAAKGFNVDAPGGDPNVGPAGTSDNKTLLGKISGAWQNLKSKIAQSGPVSGFDVTVDKLQQQLAAKSGPDSTINKAIEAYRKFGDKHPVMQGIIIAGLTAAAATAGGLGAAGIAGVAGGLRTLDRLLMGDRASSALWKGFKAAAIGYGVGQIIQGVQGAEAAPNTGAAGQPTSDMSAGTGAEAVPAPPVDTAPQTIAAQQGDTLSDIAQRMNVSVDDMLQANPQVTNPNDLGVGEIINVPVSTGNAVYQGGVGTAADTAAKVASGQYTPSRYGIQETVDWNKIRKTFAIQESLKLPLHSAVYLTSYGVYQVFETIDRYQKELDEGIWDAVKSGWNTAKNKITYDKLDMYWRRNRGENPTDGPVDSQVVIDFLTQMGVKRGLVDRAFSEVGIPSSVSPETVPSPDANNQAGTPQSPESTPGTTPTSGRVSATDAKKQIDQTVQSISRVRKRDKGRVISYAQNKFGSLAPAPSAPATPSQTPLKVQQGGRAAGGRKK